MKTMTVRELKASLSEAIHEVKVGEEIAVTFGRKKEIVAYLIPRSARKSGERKLGQLTGKGKVTFAKDFAITEEEFLRLY